jgi:hypothetical protein
MHVLMGLSVNRRDRNVVLGLIWVLWRFVRNIHSRSLARIDTRTTKSYKLTIDQSSTLATF